MKYLFLLLIFTILFPFLSNAQHEILFLDGKKITVGEYQLSKDFSGDSIVTFYHKNKTQEMLTYDVFSITDENNVETILYRKNEELGFELEKNQMKSMVLGAHEARENFKGIGATATGFAFGLTAVLVPVFNKSILLGDFNVTLIPVLPVLNTTGTAISSNYFPKKNSLAQNYPEYKADAYFVEGYRQQAKQKKVRNSIFGGLGGILVGFAILAL